MNAVQELARLYGIADAYVDYRAQPREVSLQSQAAILAAIGVDAADEQAAAAAIHQHETVRWTRLLPPVVVVESGEPLIVPVSMPLELDATWLEWRIDARRRRRSATAPRASTSSKVIEEGSAEDRAYRRVALRLPDLPLGYHTASIALDTGLSGELRLIVAPAQCYEPPSIAAGARVWGIAAQLYALRSPRNWGMGDFRDLRELIRHAAPLGCGIVGLNPLHALMPANPAHISPYSPSNRQFLNVLYIAVEDVPDFAECEAARELRREPRISRRRCDELRATTNVDYVGVAAAKFEILKLLYASFRRNHLEHGTRALPGISQLRRNAGRTAAPACDLRCARCAPAAARAAILGLAELAGGLSRSDVAGRQSLRARARAGRRVLPLPAVARGGAAARGAGDCARARHGDRPVRRRRGRRQFRRLRDVVEPSPVSCRAHRSARRPMRSR